MIGRTAFTLLPILALLLVPEWRTVDGHPQCLDFLPPFTPAARLLYCTQYSAFSCCSAADDGRVRASVSSRQRLISLGNVSNPDQCLDFVKEISCARCSPYASHVFSAESTGRPSVLAGLCRDYCLNAVAACGMSIMQRLSNTSQATYADPSAFCAAVGPVDRDYCLPGVNNFTAARTGASAAHAGSLNCVCVKEVMSGMRNPVVAAHAGDGSHRLFVGEQLGVVRILLANGSLPATPFADLQDIVVTSSRAGDERGLLGMAFHPNHSSNGFVFFHLNVARDSQGRAGLFNRVLRFTVDSGSPNQVNRSTEKTILEVSQPYANHNGGEIFFGLNDGYLYIFLGDGGSAGDPQNNGLNRKTLLGSALRLDVNTPDAVPYRIPRSNPFYSTQATPDIRQEIFAYGLRNPWRCSQDRGDRKANFTGRGQIFCGDVGQGRFEEIDLITSGGNYGWRAWEGDACYDSVQCAEQTTTIFPIHQYPHSVGKSVAGGYLYRGCLSPNLRGLYFFGDFVTGRIYGLQEVKSSTKWNATELCFGDSSICNNGLTDTSAAPHILSFGQDESGEVYLLNTKVPSPTSSSGKVFWLVDPARRGAPSACEEFFPRAGNVSRVPVHFIDGGNGQVDFSAAPPGSSAPQLEADLLLFRAAILVSSLMCLHHLM